MSTAILTVSTLLQLAAAVLSFRLVLRTQSRAWLALALAIGLMATRRIVSLSQALLEVRSPDPVTETVALAISAFMLLGVMGALRYQAQQDVARGDESAASLANPLPAMSRFVVWTAVLAGVAIIALSLTAYAAGWRVYRNFAISESLSTAKFLAHAVANYDVALPQHLGEDAGRLANSNGDDKQYLCVIDGSGTIVFHARSPEMVGLDVTHFPLGDGETPETNFGDVIAERGEWAGPYTTPNGESQIVGLASLPGNSGLVAWHTPLAELRAQYRAAVLPLTLGMILIATIMLPVAAGVITQAYNTAVNERERSLQAQQALAHQLEQAQKLEAIGTLTGGIAHDFNNLLTTVLGSLELAQLDLAPGSPPAQAVEAAQQASQRGAELTKRLLALSRKQDPEIRPMDVSAVVADIVALLKRTQPAAIEIRARMDPKVPAMLGDETQLSQALLNLGINACDAMPDGGSLTFVTRAVHFHEGDRLPADANARPGRFVEITVLDTGVGIPPDAHERVFEPFFTTKDLGKGTGLGLTMVYNCVRDHNGWVTLESRPELGTTFRLYLPLVEAAELEPAAEPPRAELTGDETILVVDDAEHVLTLARTILERCGYTVLTARDGNEAVDVYVDARSTIAAVITDLAMPKSDGRDLLRRLRERGADVPVILTSGFVAAHIPHDDWHAEGFAAFIPKPYDLDTLVGTLRRVLDSRFRSSVG